MSKRHFRRSNQDAAEYQTIQHHHKGQAQDDPDRNKNYLPAPRKKSIELKWDKDELERVHREEQLELKASLVLLLYRPDAEENADNGRNDERYKDKNPEVLVLI